DLDGDGDLDLAVAVANSAVEVLLNQGNGTFASSGVYPVGAGGTVAGAIAIDDFNGDGRLDLVAANGIVGETLFVLRGRGDGTFAALGEEPTGTGPVSVGLGDLDGDGAPDVAVANRDSNDVSILMNLGGGAFATEVRYPAGAGACSVVLGDLDADG